MELRETEAGLPRVIWLDEVGSTNAAMRELVESGGDGLPLPHGTLIATANQTTGRGRQGRGWVTPPGTAIASSLLVREVVPPGSGGEGRGLGLSWLPLLAGSAAVAALQPLFRGRGSSAVERTGDRGGDRSGAEWGVVGVGGTTEPKRVGVKWPNDVHVRGEDDAIAGRPGLKLCGILCEVLSDGSIVIGAGFNLLLQEWQLPTDRATSLLAAGADVGGAETLEGEAGQQLADRVLAAYTGELLRLVRLAGDNPRAARTRVLRDSLTLGAEVRVHLPEGELVDGRAVGLDEDGALIVDRPTTGQLIVNAADIEHLR